MTSRQFRNLLNRLGCFSYWLVGLEGMEPAEIWRTSDRPAFLLWLYGQHPDAAHGPGSATRAIALDLATFHARQIADDASRFAILAALDVLSSWSQGVGLFRAIDLAKSRSADPAIVAVEEMALNLNSAPVDLLGFENEPSPQRAAIVRARLSFAEVLEGLREADRRRRAERRAGR